MVSLVISSLIPLKESAALQSLLDQILSTIGNPVPESRKMLSVISKTADVLVKFARANPEVGRPFLMRKLELFRYQSVLTSMFSLYF